MQQMEQNLVTRQKVIDFLKANTFAVVSTISRDNKPNSGPVLYFFDDNLNFYFVTRSQSRKHINLQGNTAMSIVVGTGQESIAIQMEGHADMADDNVEYFVNELKRRKHLKNEFYGPLLTFEGGDFIIYKTSIEWMRYIEVTNEKIHTEEYYKPIAW